jgi:hypothetical protein
MQPQCWRQRRPLNEHSAAASKAGCASCASLTCQHALHTATCAHMHLHTQVKRLVQELSLQDSDAPPLVIRAPPPGPLLPNPPPLPPKPGGTATAATANGSSGSSGPPQQQQQWQRPSLQRTDTGTGSGASSSANSSSAVARPPACAWPQGLDWTLLHSPMVRHLH